MFGKFLLQCIATIVLLIPTWLFLIIKAALAPVGFAQTVLVYGLVLWIFGAAQLVLLIVLIVVSFKIWIEN